MRRVVPVLVWHRLALVSWSSWQGQGCWPPEASGGPDLTAALQMLALLDVLLGLEC